MGQAWLNSQQFACHTNLQTCSGAKKKKKTQLTGILVHRVAYFASDTTRSCADRVVGTFVAPDQEGRQKWHYEKKQNNLAMSENLPEGERKETHGTMTNYQFWEQIIKCIVNPLSAIWRIYPSSKWSSQWPYDGYIRHGWMRSCGRGRDSATPECFGRGSQGTIFVRSSKLSLFFPELCSFRRVFCFPRFCKIWRQTLEPWGFWFRQCLGALFENCAPSLGTFLRTPTTTQSIFWKFLFFFQSRAGVTCLTAMVIPRLSKLFGGGSSKTRMETWFPGVGEIERRRTADRRRV